MDGSLASPGASQWPPRASSGSRGHRWLVARFRHAWRLSARSCVAPIASPRGQRSPHACGPRLPWIGGAYCSIRCHRQVCSEAIHARASEKFFSGQSRNLIPTASKVFSPRERAGRARNSEGAKTPPPVHRHPPERDRMTELARPGNAPAGTPSVSAQPSSARSRASVSQVPIPKLVFRKAPDPATRPMYQATEGGAAP